MLPENIYPKLGYKESYTILLIIIRINDRWRRVMTDMHESIFTVSKHFSHHRPLIQPLFRSSPVFRETCMDYHKCCMALHYWSNVSSQEASTRTQEYSVLLQELSQELLQCISLAGGDIAASNTQNKGENKR